MSGPRTPPSEFLLLRHGRNEYTHGAEERAFDFTPEDARRAAAEFARRGRDLVVDFEHQTLGGGKAPAAGWIERLVPAADGLRARVRYWTPDAEECLRKGEYRYFSPTLLFSGGRLAAVHSVALTNHPALHGLEALVAGDLPVPADAGEDDNRHKEKKMTRLEEAIRRLLGMGAGTALALDDTGAADEAAAKLEALADELPGLRQAAADLAARAAADAEVRKGAILQKGLARGAFCNAQKEALLKLSDEELQELEAATPDNAAVPTQRLPEPGKGEGGGEGEGAPALTDAEKAIAKALGLTEEEFAAAKKTVAGKDEPETTEE